MSIKVKGALQASSRVPMGAQSNSLFLDVLALSHLQCLPQHHCIMLHLHRVASALPLQDWPPFHSPPLLSFHPSPLLPFHIPHPPSSPSLSSVRLVPICRGLAVRCSADRAGRSRTRLSGSAAAVFEVKVALCSV